MGPNNLKINNGIIDFIILLALVCIPVTLNLGLKTNTFFIILLTVGVFSLYLNRSLNNESFKVSKFDIFYLTLFYIIQVIGLTYSTDTEAGLKQIETKFALILFPIIFLFLFKKRNISKKLISSIIITFGLSLIFIFYLYTIPNWVFSSKYHLNSLNSMIPNEFGHVYFSMFSVFSFYSFYLYYKNTENIKARVWLLICMTLLFFIPIILTTRTATFTILVLTASIIMNDKKNRYKFLSIIGLSLFIVGFMAITSPNKVKRYSNIFKKSEFYNPIYHRKNNMICSFKIFQDNPIKGAGTGSVQPLLNKCYEEKQYWGLKHRYNSHNEILAEMARHGTIGLISIIFLFFYPVYRSFKKREYIYLYFSIIIIICSFTENIFSRQVGVVFYAFFNTLFYLKGITKSDE